MVDIILLTHDEDTKIQLHKTGVEPFARRIYCVAEHGDRSVAHAVRKCFNVAVAVHASLGEPHGALPDDGFQVPLHGFDEYSWQSFYNGVAARTKHVAAAKLPASDSDFLE